MPISPIGSAARRDRAATILHAEAAEEAARLEAQYTDEDLERLIRAKGVDAKRAEENGGAAAAAAPTGEPS